MTYKELSDIINNANIPESVKLTSNSGWECGPTEMDGVLYNMSDNIIEFTQSSKYLPIGEYKDWVILK